MNTESENREEEGKDPTDKSDRIEKLEKSIEELQGRLKEEEQRSKDYLKKLKYLQADYQNSLRRAEREIERISRCGNERLIKDLLEVLDELEFARSASKEKDVSEEVKRGINMTLNKLHNILAKEGLEVIECKNERFDPNKHQAISKEYSKGDEEGIILRELRKGYLLKGKVIRPSEVVVSSLKREPR